QRIQTEHLHGGGRFRLADLHAAIVLHGAHLAEYGAADEEVTHCQRSVAHQHGGYRTASAVELGLDHSAHGRPARVGFEVLQVGNEENHFEEQREIFLRPCGHRDH